MGRLLRESIIHSSCTFTLKGGFSAAMEIMKFRKEHKNITEMIWITKSAAVDQCGDVYNPTTLIMLFLN